MILPVASMMDELEKIALVAGNLPPRTPMGTPAPQQKDPRAAPGGGLVTGGAIAGGGAALSQAVPRVTGRSTYYHGTTGQSADHILEHGLFPSNKGGAHGVINDRGFPKEWADKAYVVGSKTKAQIYANQADTIRPGQGGGRILKMSIPEWKQGLATEVNPETAGGYAAWAERTTKRMTDQYMKAGVKPHIAEAIAQRQIKGLGGRLGYAVQTAGNERAINSVPTEFIQGSKNYQRLALPELMEYARARPGRFAGGLALGALGVGGIGYGLKRLHDQAAARQGA